MPVEPKHVEKDLDDIEKSINLLKRDFEIFFAGAAKHPPLDAVSKLEKSIKRYSMMVGLSYAQRFRYNNLAARFNAYNELWSKQLRIREEGKEAVAPHVKKTAHAAGGRQRDKMEILFENYVESRKQAGETVTNLTLNAFAQIVSKQKQALMEKYQCKDVDFFVTIESGKAKLKARPVK